MFVSSEQLDAKAAGELAPYERRINANSGRIAFLATSGTVVQEIPGPSPALADQRLTDPSGENPSLADEPAFDADQALGGTYMVQVLTRVARSGVPRTDRDCARTSARLGNVGEPADVQH